MPNVNLTDVDLNLFKVPAGAGMTAQTAKKFISLMAIFGMEVKDVIATVVTQTNSAAVRVSDLLELGVATDQPLRILLCSEQCPIIDDGKGFVEIRGNMTGTVLQQMYKQAIALGKPMNGILEIANQFAGSMPEIPGVRKPTPMEIVFGSKVILDHANAAANVAIVALGL